MVSERRRWSLRKRSNEPGCAECVSEKAMIEINQERMLYPDIVMNVRRSAALCARQIEASARGGAAGAEGPRYPWLAEFIENALRTRNGYNPGEARNRSGEWSKGG